MILWLEVLWNVLLFQLNNITSLLNYEMYYIWFSHELKGRTKESKKQSNLSGF